MKITKILSSLVGLATAMALHATPIDYAASADGIAATSDYSFSATGGALVLGNKNGISFAGVSGGASGTEIDVNQSLTVTFSDLAHLSSISLALLFNGPEYSDNNEIASILTSAGDTYELRLTGENQADWYLNNAFVAGLTGSGTEDGGKGLFTIENPFGLSLVSYFTLSPVDIHPAKYKSNSDFGLAAFTTSTVPDVGSTLSLMGVAMIGLSAFARRSRR